MTGPPTPSFIFAMALGLATCGPSLAQTQAPSSDLTEASLQELMNIQVTSVSKKEQSLSKSGASVYVISQEDIRRSGMTNIPDLLRLVPGVNVARITANTWAISIRGFNYRYSSKVLVLIDGRTVYTPGFSGVYWDQQSVPLEDIDRIEVIRGPGGTVWGANAMNGVINIITKSATVTEGALVSTGSGSQDSTQSLAQYGGSAGSKGAYRVYSRYFKVEDSPSTGPVPALDGWHGSQLGFRSDWSLSRNDNLTVQGDFFGSSESQLVTSLMFDRLPTMFTMQDKVRMGNGNILGRWDHTFSNGSEASLQVSYDRVRRLDLGSTDVLTTGDFDFHYRFKAGSRQEIVAGIGFRATDETSTPAFAFEFVGGERRDNLYSTFVQDEVKVSPNVALTIGSKFEHNDYTGFEFEPSAQLVWTPREKQTWWASASKAIQQPSWYFANSITDAFTFPMQGGVFGLYQILGNPTGQAAQLYDYEIGYRNEISSRLTLDVTSFVSDYRRLQTLEPLTAYFTRSAGPPYLVLPNIWENLGRGLDYGLEFSGNLRLTDWWRISPGFSFLQMHSSLKPGSQDTSLAALLGDSPKHEGQIRSTMNLPHHLEWDVFGAYVGALRIGPVPSYTRLDTRLGWRAGEHLEFSLSGQNLLTPHHVEFLDALQVVPTEASRSIFAKVTWRF